MHGRKRPPRPTIHLLHRPHRQPNPLPQIRSKKRLRGPRIRAQIHIDIPSKLIRIARGRHTAQGVPVRGTQVADHDDDAGAPVGQVGAAGVGEPRDLVAGAAGGAGAGARAHAVHVLRDGGAEAR